MASESLGIQLAIQGGGARLVCLLAAMQALQELQRRGVLHITRLCGTSAGAIAGTLLAAGVPIESLREQLRSEGNELLKETLRGKINKFRWALSLVSGAPVGDLAALRRLLARHFEAAEVRTFSDIYIKTGVKASVTATDLSRSETHYFADDDSIVESILDSSALPFLFRTWRSERKMLDGFLSENLPLNGLDKTQKAGPLICICFDSEPRNEPGTLLEFLFGMFQHSINNAMFKARREVAQDHIFQIKTGLSSSDFKVAVNSGLGPEYDHIRDQAKTFFSEFVRHYPSRKNPRFIGDVSQQMYKIGEVYRNLFQHTNYKEWELTMMIVAKSLDPVFSLPDVMHLESTFTTLDEPLYCTRIGLMSDVAIGTSNAIEWTIYNSEHLALEVSPLVIKSSPDDPIRDILLFFKQRLEPRSGPYHMVVRETVWDLMNNLRETGSDILGITASSTSEPVAKANLVLQVPDAVRNEIHLSLGNGSASGRAMSSEELKQFELRADLGYRTMGWTIRDLPPNCKFYLKIVRNEDK